MSLARAFTKRMKRNDDSTSPATLARGNTVRYAPGTINRNKISLPTELISTTNVHALTAPDIRKASASSSSSSSSTHSGHESDFSTIDRSFLTDTSISSPVTPMTPPMEVQKDFFDTKAIEATPTPTQAPTLPQRSPTHSKKAHVELSRSRSIQRMTPPPSVIPQATVVRTSAEMFINTPIDTSHPFGPELAQVNKVAEDFGVTSRPVLDEEEEVMLAKGLQKFDVQDYLAEIAGLSGGVFEDKLGLAANPWL